MKHVPLMEMGDVGPALDLLLRTQAGRFTSPHETSRAMVDVARSALEAEINRYVESASAAAMERQFGTSGKTSLKDALYGPKRKWESAGSANCAEQSEQHAADQKRLYEAPDAGRRQELAQAADQITSAFVTATCGALRGAQ